MDEQLRAEAAEQERERKEIEALSEKEREQYLAKKAERLAQKDEMLRSQLGVYGKNAAFASRNKKGKKKGAKGAGDTDSKRDRRQEQLAREREARQALKDKAKQRLMDPDVEAEERRLSRQRKLKELQAQMFEDEDEDAGADESLLSRLQSNTRRRSVERSDNKPLPLSIWVFILFFIVLFDRSVKFASAHVNPMMLSRGLGTLLIVASMGVKVPQIMAIQEAKTVKGLSETKAYTAVLVPILVIVYAVFNKHPFTAYGDAVSVLAQDLYIVLLMWQFGKTKPAAQAALGIAFLVYVGGVVGVASNTRPDKLWPMPLLATFIGLSGTVPQVLDNFRNEHTGPQSLATSLMLFVGTSARVFTTLADTADPIVLFSFLATSLVHGITVYQILTYWANTKRVLAKEAKKKVKNS